MCGIIPIIPKLGLCDSLFNDLELRKESDKNLPRPIFYG
jgi:hypothetical protein